MPCIFDIKPENRHCQYCAATICDEREPKSVETSQLIKLNNMTDKVQKIREAVENRYEYWKEKESNSHSIESEIRMSECKHLLLMLNSLQEEPVTSVWHDPSEKPDGKRYVLCYDERYASIAHFKEVVGCKWAYVEELYKL